MQTPNNLDRPESNLEGDSSPRFPESIEGIPDSPFQFPDEPDLPVFLEGTTVEEALEIVPPIQAET